MRAFCFFIASRRQDKKVTKGVFEVRCGFSDLFRGWCLHGIKALSALLPFMGKQRTLSGQTTGGYFCVVIRKKAIVKTRMMQPN